MPNHPLSTDAKIYGDWFKSKEGDDFIANLDRVKLTHELCNLLWVTIGVLLSMGVDVNGAMAELARANMSKLVECPDCHGEQLFFCGEGIGYQTCKKCNGLGKIALKDENGKVIKLDSFKPADMSGFVCNQ